MSRFLAAALFAVSGLALAAPVAQHGQHELRRHE